MRKFPILLLAALVLTGCRFLDPLAGNRGALLLSFDDRNFGAWEKARPVFREYGAHATFFVNGRIDRTAANTLINLQYDGHGIGLHGLKHLDAVRAVHRTSAEKYYQDEILPQLQDARSWGLSFTSFAYPNCRHSDETDALFIAKRFSYVRASAGVTPHDPKGVHQKGRISIPTADQAFLPVAEVGHGPKGRVIRTLLVGRDYQTHMNEILACLERAAAQNEIVSITSHDIGDSPSGIGMPTAWLVQILAKARQLDMPVLSFAELPKPE